MKTGTWTKRIFAVAVISFAASSAFIAGTPEPALACHSGPTLEHDVCLAVDDCHILVIREASDPIGWRYDPPQTGLLSEECLRKDE